MAKKSLLKLSCSMEDIDVEINDNTPLEETPAESDANDSEAVTEVGSASDEVEEVLRMSKEMGEIAGNFLFIGNHIKNRGITRELLAIANVNGELSAALGLPLPHFEEDSLPTDITDDQLAEVPPEVALEAIGEKIRGFLGKAKNLVTSLGGKIGNLISKYATLAGRLNNKMAKVSDKIHGNINEAETATKSLKLFSAAEYKSLVTKLNQALGQTFEIKGKESQLKWASDVLQMAGYKYTAEQEEGKYLGESTGKYFVFNTEKTKEGKIEAVKGNLGELGWNAAFFKGMFEPTKQLIGKIGDLKKFQKAFNFENGKSWEAFSAVNTHDDISDKEEAATYGRWESISSTYHVMGSVFSIVTGMAIKAINMYAMAAGKIVTNTAA